MTSANDLGGVINSPEGYGAAAYELLRNCLSSMMPPSGLFRGAMHLPDQPRYNAN